MTVAWFVDGAYAYRCWREVARGERLDYSRFRAAIEDDAQAEIEEAYYFNSDNDPPSAAQNGFHLAIGNRPPEGPGLRVKLGSLQKHDLYWPEHLGGGLVTHPNDPNVAYEIKNQKEVDVLLAFYLMRSHAKRGWKKLYLVAGDRDFFEPVKRLVEDEGVDVTLFGVRGGGGRQPSISAKYGPYGRAIYFEDIVGDLKMAGGGEAE